MLYRVALSYLPDPRCHGETDAIGLGLSVTSTDDAPSHLTWEVPKGDRS